ncbi:hypothetical protein BU23DRAFT_299110 [Bimuria novae-zelandiae CBS 107.79]|uniref:Uncharacterized protein n=1 Tax=Bimuria novae-zelandiae CBS 107.79 TaxID=1447943 RepID=A0A6A5VRQ9_9PLEO|nr:hypothetical protein BU23DRAFT_299110 [Bimuria novae-zelandiae CBS 107.79]
MLALLCYTALLLSCLCFGYRTFARTTLTSTPRTHASSRSKQHYTSTRVGL